MGGTRPPFGQGRRATNQAGPFGPRRGQQLGTEPPEQTDLPSGATPPAFGPRRRQQLERLNQIQGETAPGPAPFASRRRREPTLPQQQDSQPALQVPAVPPVPQKSKPKRNDSLLESIIKLVNSILTFKGK